MGDRGAVESTLRSFLSESADEIVAAWEAAVKQFPSNQGTPALPADTAARLLELIADLSDQLARGEPVERTFELARARTRRVFERPTDLSRIVAELSVLRGCVTSRWMRAHSTGGDDRALRAVDTAIDALIAASAAREEDASRAQFERLAAERERALGKLESLLAASPVGIAFLDRDLRYLRINEALATMHGRPAAEHIGRTLGEVLPEAERIAAPMLREIMATGQPVLNRELTRPAASPDDVPRIYLATYFPVRARSGEITGVGGVVADVTEARQAEEDLRRVQEWMQSILEHTPASIWVKDDSGRIVLANHRLADALGHRYEDVIGRRSEELLPPEVAAQHRAHDLTVTRDRRAIEAEEVVPAPDGVRTFLSSKFPLPGDPPLVGGIATDISDRKRMEEELRVAVRSRERVLAAVSHDLRTPLHAIQVASATLLGHLGSEQRWRRQLQVIHRSCLRMEHLIGDLLDMASIGAGRLSIETRPEPADLVLREACELHQALADEKKIALTVRHLEDDVLVECDRQRILQVFDNLIGNALKFCRAGDRVTLGGERGDGVVRFHVDDTGPGIAPGLIVHLFDPYWSGPDARGGVGLGLYIARGIVERHGGTIDLESEVGRGARFSFTIPVAVSESA